MGPTTPKITINLKDDLGFRESIKIPLGRVTGTGPKPEAGFL